MRQKQQESGSSRQIYPISLSKEEISALETIEEKLGCSRADAIRQSINEYANQIKGVEVVKIRDVSKEVAKKEILDYLRKNDRAWSNEIADDLRLDIVQVTEVLDELWKGDDTIEPVSK